MWWGKEDERWREKLGGAERVAEGWEDWDLGFLGRVCEGGTGRTHRGWGALGGEGRVDVLLVWVVECGKDEGVLLVFGGQTERL